MPKFKWRSLHEKDEKLGYDTIPENAILLNKTKSHDLIQLIYLISIFAVSFFTLLSTRYHNGHFEIGRIPILIGIVLGLLSGFLHEILHGIIMPSDAVVYIGLNKNKIGMYEFCARATKKSIFIISSAMPIIIGIIPFILFIFIDSKYNVLSGLLWGFATTCLISVCSDIADIIFMMIHVPSKHYIQPGNGFYVHYKP